MKSYYLHFYRNILIKDTTLLNRTRLRILFACILNFLVLTAVLMVIYIVNAHNLLLYRVAFFFILFATSLYLFLSKRTWQRTAHFFLICVTLLIWTNVLLIRQSLYVVNMQYCLLVIAAGYYILGSKNGLRYAIVAIIPLVAEVLMDEYLNIRLPSKQVDIDHTAYAITIAINFVLLLYIHHLFFRSLTKFKKREALFKRNLEQALTQAQEQALMKTNFLNAMSHEIRTPLNAVVGMSQLLLSGVKLPEQEENLQVLNFSAENLMSTVNDIIDFSNLDNNSLQLQLKPFSLYQTIHNVCATFSNTAKNKGLHFTCQVDEQLQPTIVNGDELRLSQILFHLIGNAVKFTSEGFVSVSVNRLAAAPVMVEIAFQIKDSGIGISKAKLEQLVNPFSIKLPRTKRQYQTTLGLTVAYHLIRLHGSDLEIESKEGQGSSFRFTLSYAVATDHYTPASSTSSFTDNSLSGMQVLVVDDEKLNIMVVKKILAKWNILAAEAANGKIALEMCLVNHYDLILMDINMPVMDGFEAAKAIKCINRPNFVAPRIIALTASVGAAVDEVLKHPYIDDCVLKPFKPEELKQKMLS